MKINLKDGIWISGFDQESLFSIGFADLYKTAEILYVGKTSEIPEELAKEVVRHEGLEAGTQMDDGEILSEDYFIGYKQYEENIDLSTAKLLLSHFTTAKESIKSACKDDHCLIYKIS